MHEYGIKPIRKPAKGRYDAIVLAVAHKEFRDMGVDAIRSFAKQTARAVRHQVRVRGRRGGRAPVAMRQRLRDAHARACRGQTGCSHSCGSGRSSRRRDFGHIVEQARCRCRSGAWPAAITSLRFQFRQRAARDVQELHEFAAASLRGTFRDVAWDRYRARRSCWPSP